AILLFDSAKCLCYLNPAGEMLLAISAHKALGMKAETLLNSDRGKFITDLEATLATGAPRVERNLPLSIGERTVSVHCSLTPLLEGEQVRAVIVQIEELEHYQQLSRDEQWSAQQNAVHQLLRGLAHEIKNPLGGLRGAAQLLSSELHDPELLEYTSVIIAEADRLRALIDRLLAPDQPPRKSKLNIHEVLERVRQVLEAEYPRLGFQCDYDPSLPQLYGDLDQLIQAFLNVTRNAAQALEGEGEITLRTRIQRQVTIRQRLHKLVLRIDIIDPGPGIPEALQDQIFYPMITGRAEGTGLGLTFAQTLISRHHGMIEYRTRPGQTCFSVYLPLENDDAP
ncbi:MAG TPA: PAS domain-containing sensor histidine kinase, partial [Methylothermaceae bacterium]|nr:PAS domain-containing sensor histidine kinase [Methylothermaceae bacterium]